ncbi:hypothetical protein, conserved [Plasmodium gonderi]|uniref:Uncharacterized protein n=1 Tax=Plasmodium gonderi TaxID=77519 RepID=A0A1Y1JL03_PLAGO|nr:hypothetical protein, conserved [Plasmodium gonderi]GAW83111.1 hypothetical protein, conserved [Plasmodium gonderi]
MNKILKVKNYICNNVFFKNVLFSNMKVRQTVPSSEELFGKNGNFILFNLNCSKKKYTMENDYFSILLNESILIHNKEVLSEHFSNGKNTKQMLRFWNRSPGARYPKKANNGARPDCRSIRKIRKRLKTGK